MHKLPRILLLLFVAAQIHAQTEVIKPVNFNAPLYYSNIENAKASNLQFGRSVVLDKEIVLFSPDTLTLPFVDDFSAKDFNQQFDPSDFITMSDVIVKGGCLADFNIDTDNRRYMLTPSFDYVYNLNTNEIDSTQKAPIQILILDPLRCFKEIDAGSVFLTVWPTFYHQYTFDQITGKALDSVFVGSANMTYPDTVVAIQTMQYAKGAAGSKWMDNHAFINSTLPLNPPSIGVATLDGINRYGLPYSEGGVGTADVLTSKPIDLGGLIDADSVYLSFFYQPTGLGDMPDQMDSLLLEFRDVKTDKWNTIWKVSGFSTPTPTPPFQQILVRLVQPQLINEPN